MFLFDEILPADEICNLQKERRSLQKLITEKRKIVVFGPRNYGKTSLIKNVIIPQFQAKHPNSFVFFVDLMDVKSLENIDRRILMAFEHSFSTSFPKKALVRKARELLTSFKPQVNLDPLTGEPSISLGISSSQSTPTFMTILEKIRTEIFSKISTLLIMDEFQDIAFIPEAAGLFRKEFQEFSKVPIVLLGSKQHLLAQLFSEPNSPLHQFGVDVEFTPIQYEEYHQYILERFQTRGISISFETAKTIQNLMHRVPEAINILCANILDQYQNISITEDQVRRSILRVLEARQSRFEAYLGNFHDTEERFLVALAKAEVVTEISGKKFLSQVNLTARAASQISKRLRDRSVIDKTVNGFRVADPLLAYYLTRYR